MTRLPALQSPFLSRNRCRPSPCARAFPGFGVLRRLRPVPDRSAVDAPSPPRRPAAGETGETRDGSRVHCDSLDEVGTRLCPCGIAASAP